MGRARSSLERRNAYRILVENPEGKRALRRPRRRWKVDIKLYLSETGDMDWIRLAKDRDQCLSLVSTVMNLRVPSNMGKFLSS
jgi:hypothetical protein